MKKIVILLVIPIFFGFKTGDEFDEKKMNRDLEIAKNILVTLIKSGSDSFFGGESLDASYIKDYGVVFSIPEHLVYFHAGGNFIAIPEMPPIPEIEVDVSFDSDIDEAYSEREKAKMKAKIKKAEKETQRVMVEVERAHEDMEQAHEEASAALAEAHELEEIYISNGKTSDINWENIMITFMTDYSDLIAQLQPNEKIVIKQKAPYEEMTFIWKGSGSSEKVNMDNISISAEVLRKDVTAYKSGKINKDEFVKRITIEKKNAAEKSS